ncbi:MAG TPA: LiaF-related protein [Clostridia bacterium]|nr:LiaF-related protein [Clostridia bacterium]
MNVSKKRLVFGLIVLLVAVFLALKETELLKGIDISDYIFPGIIIIFGLYSVIVNTFKPWSVAILAFGIVILLDNINVIPESFPEYVLYLAIVGLTIIWSAFWAGSKKKLAKTTDNNAPDYFCVFGGVEAVNESKEFVSAKVTAIFGGVELDMRNAVMKGDEAFIDVFVVFGGADITVPLDWQVTVKGVPIFGGAENKVRKHEGSKMLRVNYVALFGGLTVKD